MDRRALLVGLGAAASPFVLPRWLARAGAADNPFTLGVAAGEPWPDGFVLWTRLAPTPLATDGLGGLSGPVAVRWEVFADEALKTLAAAGQVQTDARLAHAVHVEVAGLRPNRPYWYRFTALGAQSPVGKAKTAPAPGEALNGFKITAASCANYEVGWFSAYRHMAAEAPDLALFLGDYIYEYSYPQSRTDLARRHDIATEARTLAEYRNRYAIAKMDPDLQAVHHASACLVTWDDHELHNDYADRWSAIDSIREDVFWNRRVDAYQAFYEHMPLRRRSIPADGRMQLYDRHRFGDLVQFHVLDSRQYKSRQLCRGPQGLRGHVEPVTCPAFTDPERSMLGRAQEAWLNDGFQRSTARWNIIAHQTQFTPYIQKGQGGVIGEYTENWGAQGQSRQRMVDAIVDSKVRNPVMLGGDIHCYVAADLTRDQKNPLSAPVASEFVGTSVTSDQMANVFLETQDQNPHVKFVDNKPRGYMTATLERGRMHTDFRGISNRLDRDATVRTVKSFVVEDGKRGLIPL